MTNFTELHDILKTLGFKQEHINYAIKNLKPSKTMEELVDEAINIISKKYKII